MNRILAIFITICLLITVSACNNEQAAESTADSQQQSAPQVEADKAIKLSTDTAAELSILYERYNQASLKLNPILATFRGVHDYDNQWPNSIGNEYRAKNQRLQQSFLDQARDIGAAAFEARILPEQDHLSYEIFIRDRETALRGMDFPDYLMPVNQFRNPVNLFAQLGSGQNAQPFDTEQGYRNFIQRAQEFAVFIEQAILNMRAGIQQGVVQPKILMERVLPQLQAHLVDNVQDSLFYGPLRSLPEDMDANAQQALVTDYAEMISGIIIPSITRLHHFIENEYLGAARESSGMQGLPNGKGWYDFLVETTTSTNLTPDAIHQVGLSEVARIHHEMRGVMSQVNFEGDLQDFFNFTTTDAQFIFDDREQMLSAYEALRKPVDKAANQLFSIRPQADFEIRLVEPYRERSASSASYQSPAPDGSRPGIFYVNAYDLSARQNWTVTSLYLHEAVPGHHFQLALQQELDNLPAFRLYGGTTAFVEGWGLYAESLGQELDVYSDPYQYYGTLAAELWRAIRLVVDTGLHIKGWSRQDVLDYMYANAPVAEARAVSEAERFMAIPSQALAYKVGQLKIQNLRLQAELALGDKFDVRDFHSQVLTSGALPLNILENKINHWIETQQ